MIYLTNSIFKTFISCPARAMSVYAGRVAGDKTIVPSWEDPSTESMAAGRSLTAACNSSRCWLFRSVDVYKIGAYFVHKILCLYPLTLRNSCAIIASF